MKEGRSVRTVPCGGEGRGVDEFVDWVEEMIERGRAVEVEEGEGRKEGQMGGESSPPSPLSPHEPTQKVGENEGSKVPQLFVGRKVEVPPYSVVSWKVVRGVQLRLLVVEDIPHIREL